MAKSAINKNYKINAKGIICLDEDNMIGIENVDTGEFIELAKLFSDFIDRSVSLSISYDEDYSE